MPSREKNTRDQPHGNSGPTTRKLGTNHTETRDQPHGNSGSVLLAAPEMKARDCSEQFDVTSASRSHSRWGIPSRQLVGLTPLLGVLHLGAYLVQHCEDVPGLDLSLPKIEGDDGLRRPVAKPVDKRSPACFLPVASAFRSLTTRSVSKAVSFRSWMAWSTCGCSAVGSWATANRWRLVRVPLSSIRASFCTAASSFNSDKRREISLSWLPRYPASSFCL